MEIVELCEVGPRDGFQFEEVPIPTLFKVAAVEALMIAGLRRIQITSFVHPRLVPQMADAEEVVSSCRQKATDAGVILSALALNMRGVERAIDAGVSMVDLSIALNEQHAKDNTNSSVHQGIELADEMVVVAQAAGLAVQLGFQTVWGYSAPEDTESALIEEVLGRFGDRGLDSISLADSTGMAAPDSVRRVLDLARRLAPGTPIVLHLHDTRGLGLVNIAAALDSGVRRFDTSLGGLGGCPFIPGATGNVATEDVAYLATRLGYETGIDLGLVSQVSRDVERLVGHPLSGRLYRQL